MTAFPKFQYVRSKKLLQAVASIECQHCGRHGYTQAAHGNESWMGKGRSIKASDVYTAALCEICHAALDQGSHMTREQRVTMWGDAHIKTVRELVKRGLWPLDLEIPEIRQFN